MRANDEIRETAAPERQRPQESRRHGRLRLRRTAACEAFSLLELTIVMTIIVMLTGLIAAGVGGSPAGVRRGAISQVMGALDEARMSAIERGQRIYFGVADENHPNEDLRLRGYILFRKQTSVEEPDSEKRKMVPLTRWERLPQGFYFDPASLEQTTTEIKADGLPSATVKVRAMAFDSLGQLKEVPVTTGSPSLTVSEAVFTDGSLHFKNDRHNDFSVQVYRFTGKVCLGVLRTRPAP